MVEALIQLLIAVIIVGLIAGAVILIVRRAPFIEQPYKSWVEWAVLAIAVLVLVRLALPLIDVNF